MKYYLNHLLDEHTLPKPFSKAHGLTVYKRELYEYGESINLCTLLRGRSGALQPTLDAVLTDRLGQWVKKDGSFRSRELLAGGDNVPMYRWAQAQMFGSLASFRHEQRGAA